MLGRFGLDMRRRACYCCCMRHCLTGWNLDERVEVRIVLVELGILRWDLLLESARRGSTVVKVEIQ